MNDEQASDAQRWNRNYQEGRPPWDLDGPPPALTALIDRLRPSPLRVLVPCAGLGHDAIAWAGAGHHTVAVDFAALAVEGARRLADRQDVVLDVIQGDILQLANRHAGAFDLVWEQTCLCAIEPDQRRSYFQVMASVLTDGGDWYGLLWNHGRAGGPPYDLSMNIIEALFPPVFKLESWEWVKNSAPTRRNEFLVHLTRSP